MKYLKKYESLETPEVGDYVLMKSETSNEKLADLINTTIGKIDSLAYRSLYVRYNFSKEILNKFRFHDLRLREFDKNQIVAFAKTIKELELKIQVKNYNL